MDPKNQLPWLLTALLGTACLLLFATRERGGGGDITTSPRADVPEPPSAISGSSAAGSPGAADLDTILGQAANPVRRGLIVSAVEKLAAVDPSAALDRVERDLEGEERAAATRAALRVWAKADPEAAGEWVLAMRNDPAFEPTLVAFAGDWASIAPPAAAAWVSGLENDGTNESAADAVARIWAKGDALAALAWAEGHFRLTGQGTPFQRAIASLTVTDPQSAADALRDAPADLGFQGHSQLAATWAQKDPGGGAAWAAALPEGRDKNAALRNIVDEWSQRAPSEAAEFLLTLSPAAQASAVAPLVSNWTDSDAVRASQWLANLPDGATRDEAIAGFAFPLSFTDPASALTWTMNIGDAEMRDAQVGTLLLDWHDREPEQARRWMESQPGLSNEIKATVLEL